MTSGRSSAAKCQTQQEASSVAVVVLTSADRTATTYGIPYTVDQSRI